MTQSEFLSLSKSAEKSSHWLAENIGGCSRETWARWCGKKPKERGQKAPAEVIDRLKAYVSRHADLMRSLSSKS